MKTIVVGFDGSEHADRALDRAAELADDTTELVVVTAARLTTGAARPRSVGVVDPIEEDAAAEALDRARAALEGRDVAARMIEGRGGPADAIVRLAKDEGAELIVVGTRGQNVAQRALLGSVSTKVVHDAECDVLVVR